MAKKTPPSDNQAPDAAAPAGDDVEALKAKLADAEARAKAAEAKSAAAAEIVPELGYDDLDLPGKTGWFDSMLPPSRGRPARPRIDALGGKQRELRLRGISDGYVRSFVDDGADEEGAANQARGQLCRSLSQTVNGFPAFFVDKGVSVAPIPFNGVNLRVPVADDAIMAEMRRMQAKRRLDEEEADRFVANKISRQREQLAKAAAARGGDPEVAQLSELA